MTNFIPAVSVRDYNLSKAIMAHIAQIIEIENTTHGYDIRQYVEIDNKGVVTRCAMILIEGVCATVLYTHDVSLDDTEALVRDLLPEITHLQSYLINPTAPHAGWKLLAANFRSRVNAPVKQYQFFDTDNPTLKQCETPIGSALCSVVGNYMSLSLKDEAVCRTTQQTVDAMCGVAVSEQKMFMVQCLSKTWAEAFEANPNYEFHNALVAKTLG